MAVTVMTGLGVFKSLYDSAKALKDMNDAAIRNAAVIELQEQILSAQEAQSTLLERVGELEKEVASFEKWDAEKENYDMHALGSGSIVYILKPEIRGTQPSHYLCASCYEHRQRSILQKMPGSSAHAALGRPQMYKCPECKTEVVA
jgi:hypothetical protein